MKNFFIIWVFGLLLVSCSGDEEPVEQEEPAFEYVGDWLGNWSDSLFPFIAVSAVVRRVGNNSYSGSFYYQSNGNAVYTPCCGGPDDGKFSFKTDGGDNVMDFVYNQTAPEYNGGCPGIYEGSGAIDRDRNRLIINFTGNDCDGFHDSGMIVWELDK